MRVMKNRSERLMALVLAGVLAFNYPLLSLFADGGLLLGIPILYLYLFVLWGIFILCTGLIIESKASGRTEARRHSKRSMNGKTDDA